MINLMTRVRAVTVRVPRMPWRPAPATTPPAYVKCAGCRRGGRDDQQVPDPAQFANKLGSSTGIVGNAAAVPAKAPDPIEVNVSRLNLAPGVEAARLSKEIADREKDGTLLRLTDAAPVWCATCHAWYHAIGCYSLHRHE